MSDPEKIEDRPDPTVDVVSESRRLDVPITWHKGTLVQVLVVGAVSFLAPGAYAALASTGAGGLANVRRVYYIIYEKALTIGQHRQRIRCARLCAHRALRPSCE